MRKAFFGFLSICIGFALLGPLGAVLGLLVWWGVTKK